MRFVLVLAIVLGGCGDDGAAPGEDDGGPPDAGPTDGGAPDSGPPMSGIGAPCTSSSECDPPADLCLTDVPGGYCTHDCTADAASCGEGAACVDVGTPAGGRLCLRTCTTMADCAGRSDWICTPLEPGGPGPTYCLPIEAEGDAGTPDAGSMDGDGGIAGDAGPCTGTLCSGACIDLASDPRNCGECGRDCNTLPHVTPGRTDAACIDGRCSVVSCEAPYGSCPGGEPACTTDLSGPLSCGPFCEVCPAFRPACVSAGDGTYECAVGCPGAEVRCDGACTDIAADERSCGACGFECPAVPYGRPECVAGVCTPVCDAGFHRACGGYGCVPDTDTSSCGPSCVLCPGGAHTRTSCDGRGGCGYTCEPGWGDCDGRPPCETDITSTAACGGCGRPACIGGSATPVCAPDGSGGYRCASGCPAGTVNCGGACSDPMTDIEHCGGCYRYCPAPAGGTATCTAGVCGFVCGAGTHRCGSSCVRNDSIASCGSSCTACPSGPYAEPTCDGTRCGLRCLGDNADCDGDPANGCETPLGSRTSCGGCGVACAAGESCRPEGSSWRCTGDCAPLATCAAGAAGSSCADLASDVRHCGTCATDCTTMPLGTWEYAVCRDGRCATECIVGTHRCGDVCVNDFAVATCGDRCTPCPVPVDAVATCDGTSCGYRCVDGTSRCRPCATDSDCADGAFCNGAERCMPGATTADARGCVAGTRPCTTAGSTCSETEVRCVPPLPPPTPSTTCRTNADCADAYFCNGTETCSPGTPGADVLGCVSSTACPSGLGFSCDESADRCRAPVFIARCFADWQCDNGLFCDGLERCRRDDPGADVFGCIAGPEVTCSSSYQACFESPAGCASNLGGPCTRDADCVDAVFCNGAERCELSLGRCVLQTMACRAGEECDEDRDRCLGACDRQPDADGDGHRALACGGDDCDDGDIMRYAGRAEVCDASHHDEDCDPTTFGNRDMDSDGHFDARCCNVDDATGTRYCGRDCDDSRAGVSPTVPEVCDDFDNDCDGMTNEGVGIAGWADADGDGRGDPSRPGRFCSGMFATNANDCDDSNPFGFGPGDYRCDPGGPGRLICQVGGTWMAATCPTGTTCYTDSATGRGTCR